MAETWKPDPTEPIGPGEPIGRRIDDDPVWSDELGQGKKHVLRQDHFYDSRLPEDLSFDRLGRNGSPDKKVLAVLEPLAVDEAEKRNVTFSCWAFLRHSKIVKADKEGPYEIYADPIIDDPNGSKENPYHAQLSRKQYRDKENANLIALHLAHIFGNDGALHFKRKQHGSK